MESKRKTFVVSYLTDKDGIAEVDEEQTIQKALAEAISAHAKKFVVVPNDFVNQESVIDLGKMLAENLPPFTTREEFLALLEN